MIITESAVYAKAVTQETKQYSDRLTQENQETQPQELDEKAKQQLENGELETVLYH